ncbi:MAG: hypothetical protein AB8V19_03155 [Candidatus Midichloria sp.]|uniref:Uncharacterized protein n=1 Tax=Hyalomma marginatum TaxID=34627 RepID=A0A8S4C4Q2_9ACAR|nr:hypothetical protein MHYMCMPASI_00488 [Hyalomma marginatum]CAG7598711.1 hypothetical protein MHYMCMPSP_01148 [Hyalomma marginatum]
MYDHYDKWLSNVQKMRGWSAQYNVNALEGLCLNLINPKKIILGDKDEITPNYLMTKDK